MSTKRSAYFRCSFVSSFCFSWRCTVFHPNKVFDTLSTQSHLHWHLLFRLLVFLGLQCHFCFPPLLPCRVLASLLTRFLSLFPRAVYFYQLRPALRRVINSGTYFVPSYDHVQGFMATVAGSCWNKETVSNLASFPSSFRLSSYISSLLSFVNFHSLYS